MSKRLEGKVVLVTGASSIGPGISSRRASALCFAEQGIKVCVLDRSIAAAEKACRPIAENGGKLIALEADVTVEDHVARAIGECLSTLRTNDILLNNVDILVAGGAADTEFSDWDPLTNVWLPLPRRPKLWLPRANPLHIVTEAAWHHLWTYSNFVSIIATIGR